MLFIYKNEKSWVFEINLSLYRQFFFIFFNKQDVYIGILYNFNISTY